MFNVEDLMSKADLKSADEKKALFEAFINLSIYLDINLWPDGLTDCLDTICEDPRISVESFRMVLNFLLGVSL